MLGSVSARAGCAMALGLVATLSIGTPARALSSADATAERREQLRYATETVNLASSAFLTRKANFLAAGCLSVGTCRKPTPYHAFDWTSDSCSWTPNSWTTMFDPACQQHDFAYRNFGKGLTLGRSESTRRWIDDAFRAEMKAICSTKFTAWWQVANRQVCFKEADAIYGIVRVTTNWSAPLPSP